MRMASTRLATARQAFAACLRNLMRSKRGQRKTPASVETTPAITQPPTRAGIAEAGAGMDTAITNERSMPVCAAATYPPKTRLKAIVKPIVNVTAVASPADADASVPIVTSIAPTSVAVR